MDTLRVKLFLATAGANLVLVAVVYLIYSWSFERSLFDYVNRSELERLSPVIAQLSDGYRKNGDWTWLTNDRDSWGQLVRIVLGVRGERTPRPTPPPETQPGATTAAGPEKSVAAGGSPDSSATPGHEEFKPDRRRGPDPRGDRYLWTIQDDEYPLTFDYFRLMLFDANGKSLILSRVGSASDAEAATKLPITVDGRVVGYLGYIPRLQRFDSLESITRKQQANRIQVIGLGMFAAVLIIAWLVANWLARRLRVLGQGATALARGDYATRIPVAGHDELARLAGDFNHLAAALEAAQRGRQQWIADIAHELRTPLTALRAEIEAVQDGVRPLTPSSIASVAQEVHRLTRLVEDLRLLTLSDLGALTYRKEPLDLGESIADAIAASRAAIDQKQLNVQLQLVDDIYVDADDDRLAQVFSNLLQNTLRYTTAPGSLRVSLVVEGREARIDWEDSAPGVGTADLARLTERLYRVDSSRSSSSGGSGLGLAIVQAIVNAHGGRMEATHSTLGGLCWHIWLPLTDHARA